MSTFHKGAWAASAAAIFSLSMLTACQPRNEPVNDKEKSAPAAEVKAESIPLIESKAAVMKLMKPDACDAEGCTRYSIQTVETNVDWINQYFTNRMKKADPIAFSNTPNEKVNLSEGADPGLNQSTTTVRYISQWGKIATFALESYTYTAGAAHGMSHVEYINFDLKAKKRLALQDILAKGADSKVLSALYDSNSMWLEEHNIERSKLQLSDNFYYGASGIVFVYPLYELASYAEGMTELNLPYHMVKGLFKAEYLPNLPNYENQ
ncbi:RsiV family protein [Acinetobacter sp.]|uniref:RsiV family protein n=1 Tax=Acinetobacter sp. TaxID=472 RepID=UPI0035AEF77C